MSETTPNPPTDPRDGFTPGPWRAEFNTYRENGSLTITDSYIHSPEGARMFLDCDPEQASRIVDGMNERTTLLADNERLRKRVADLEEMLDEADDELWLTYPNGETNTPAANLRERIRAALALAGQKGNEHGT